MDVLPSRFSAIRCNTALPARIKPNTKSASVFLWCPWILRNKDLTCSSQSLHNGVDASIEIVPPRCCFYFLLVETISVSLSLFFFALLPKKCQGERSCSPLFGWVSWRTSLLEAVAEKIAAVVWFGSRKPCQAMCPLGTVACGVGLA